MALTDFPEREAQLSKVERLLDTSLRTEVCVSPFGDLRVSLESLRPGHNFPSGASQDRRVWVEVRGYAAGGEELFAYGAPPAGTPVTDVPDAWVLRDLTFKANGEPAHMFWYVARFEEQTIPAPLTRSPLVEGYHREVVRRQYQVPPGFTAARVAVLVRMQPVGLDALDDLVQSGHLDPSIRQAMPTFDLLPNRTTSNEVATLVWTFEKARSEGFPANDYLCLETARQVR